MTAGLLQQGIKAAYAGDFEQAREILARAVRDDPKNAKGWLVLGYCAPDAKLRSFCMREVLKLDPANELAKQLLEQPFNPSRTAFAQLMEKVEGPKTIITSFESKPQNRPDWLLALEESVGIVDAQVTIKSPAQPGTALPELPVLEDAPVESPADEYVSDLERELNQLKTKANDWLGETEAKPTNHEIVEGSRALDQTAPDWLPDYIDEPDEIFSNNEHGAGQPINAPVEDEFSSIPLYEGDRLPPPATTQGWIDSLEKPQKPVAEPLLTPSTPDWLAQLGREDDFLHSDTDLAKEEMNWLGPEPDAQKPAPKSNHTAELLPSVDLEGVLYPLPGTSQPIFNAPPEEHAGDWLEERRIRQIAAPNGDDPDTLILHIPENADSGKDVARRPDVSVPATSDEWMPAVADVAGLKKGDGISPSSQPAAGASALEDESIDSAQAAELGDDAFEEEEKIDTGEIPTLFEPVGAEVLEELAVEPASIIPDWLEVEPIPGGLAPAASHQDSPQAGDLNVQNSVSDWLAQAQEDSQTIPAEEPASAPQAELPEWLQPTPAEVPAPALPDSLTTQQIVSDWLMDMEAEDEATPAASAAPPASEVPQSDVADWLGEVEAETQAALPEEPATAPQTEIPDWLELAPATEPAAPPASETLQADVADWLAEVEAETQTALPEESASAPQTELPDWLELAPAVDPAAPPASEAPQADVADWLAEVEAETQTTPEEPPPVQPASEAPQRSVSDWLAEIEAGTQAAAAPPPEPQAGTSELPQWLEFTPAGEAPAAPPAPQPKPEKVERSVADWLAQVDTTAADPSQSGEVDIPVPTTNGDVPDWLKIDPFAETTAQPEAGTPDETPGWLAEVETEPQERPAVQPPASIPLAPENEPDSVIPDWLELKPLTEMAAGDEVFMSKIPPPAPILHEETAPDIGAMPPATENPPTSQTVPPEGQNPEDIFTAGLDFDSPPAQPPPALEVMPDIFEQVSEPTPTAPRQRAPQKAAKAKPSRQKQSGGMGAFLVGIFLGTVLMLAIPLIALLLTGDPRGTVDRMLLAINGELTAASGTAELLTQAAEPSPASAISPTPTGTRLPTNTPAPTPMPTATSIPQTVLTGWLDEAERELYTEPEQVIILLQPVTEEFDDPLEQARAALVLAVASAQLGKINDAAAYYNRVIDVLEPVRDDLQTVEQIATANAYLTAAASMLDRQDQVIAYNEALVEMLLDELDELDSFTEVDLTYRTLQSAYDTLRAAGRTPTVNLNTDMLARLPDYLEDLESAGDISQAYQYLMDAARNTRQVSVARTYARAMINQVTPLLDGMTSPQEIGAVYLRLSAAATELGETANANQYLESLAARLISLENEAKSPAEQAALYSYLGEANMQLKRPAISAVYYQKLLSVQYTPEHLYDLALALDQSAQDACAYEWYGILTLLKGYEAALLVPLAEQAMGAIEAAFGNDVPVCQ